jgi:Na+/melibiose symporter-like transporter
MNQWAFVMAAYVVALIGTSALLVCAYLSMRRSEAEADKLRTRE